MGPALFQLPGFYKYIIHIIFDINIFVLLVCMLSINRVDIEKKQFHKLKITFSFLHW